MLRNIYPIWLHQHVFVFSNRPLYIYTNRIPFIWTRYHNAYVQTSIIVCNYTVQFTHRQNGYDDVIKWKHFSRYWPFVRDIHRCDSTVCIARCMKCVCVCVFVKAGACNVLGERLLRRQIIVLSQGMEPTTPSTPLVALTVYCGVYVSGINPYDLSCGFLSWNTSVYFNHF